MKKWIVINADDGNNSFEVEGETAEEAAFTALESLGWYITEMANEEGDE